jgi:hypothetical protein
MTQTKYEIIANAGAWSLYRVDYIHDEKPSHYYQLRKASINGIYTNLNFQEKNLRSLKLMFDGLKIDDWIKEELMECPKDSLMKTKVIDDEKVLIDPYI